MLPQDEFTQTLIIELEAEKYILGDFQIDWERSKNLKTKFQNRVDLALLRICFKLRPDIKDVLQLFQTEDSENLYIFLCVLTQYEGIIQILLDQKIIQKLVQQLNRSKDLDFYIFRYLKFLVKKEGNVELIEILDPILKENLGLLKHILIVQV